MKEYSLGLGARRIFPTEGYKGKWASHYRGSKNGTPAVQRRSGAKPQKPKTYFWNKILKHYSCIRHHSSIGI